MSTGVSFTDEYSVAQLLQAVVWDAIPGKNGCPYPLVMREFDGNRGRADVVCAVFQDQAIDMNGWKLLGEAFSEINRASILVRLHRSTTRHENYIQEALGLAKRSVRRHIHYLVDIGLVDRTPTGLLRLAKPYCLPKVEVWAFEVKLRNWRRAFYQALRYRGFSHNVVVVMPTDRLNAPRSNLSHFVTMNVGLAGIAEDGKIEFVSKPQSRSPLSKGHYLYGLGRILTQFTGSYANTPPEASESTSPVSQVAVT